MLRITIETDAETRVVDLAAEEQKALEVVANMPVDLIENFILTRAHAAIVGIVQEYSDRQPGKISPADRRVIVLAADIPSAAERNAEAEGRLLGKVK